MRITNKIIQNNSLTNINKNKVLEDKLNTQITTKKKINRPSDDPVVAIRALRLRTNLSNINQYYEKNVPDAKSWMSVTEDAINTVTQVVTDVYHNCTRGAQGSLTASDRLKVLESMKGLREGVYATGDADYAGRYVFTGYRTDSSLMFTSDTTQNYRITEQLSSKDVLDFTNVDIADLGGLTQSNAASLTANEQAISTNQVHRIRLSYEECSSTAVPSITYYDTTATLQTITPAVVSVYDMPTPYLSANWPVDPMTGTPPSAVFIAETGEIILNDTTYNALQNTIDDVATQENEGKISVTYEKDTWKKGDIKPEHYFACTSGTTSYNADLLTDSTLDDTNQAIYYDVGFSQKIQVNTLAKDVFKHSIGREIDELIEMTESVIKMESSVKTLQEMSEADPTNTAITTRLQAAQKAYEMLKEKMQKGFEKGISSTQGYLDQANLALTNMGTRASKLELIENRLLSQQTNFETLQSENEDIDIAEAALQLSSVQLSYDAALMATAKIAQTTLLNYL